ncbi:hypothetical protein Vadar_015658 [Vaccinium darrowii]|uniref:Uncharacterized protein n=1 Tax=Vaccinium darrowii TaxID=229202 RepID=A0ACB7XZ96_9ERIC|nr:hypothetical protein Vadar_015658 [Vaccinium darrowii]
MRHSKSLWRAQRYCNGNFTTWDPMITTPPEVICRVRIEFAKLLKSSHFGEEQPVEPELPKYRDRAKERREDQNPDYEASELGSFHAVAPPRTVDLLCC